jgi:hypothetical protein
LATQAVLKAATAARPAVIMQNSDNTVSVTGAKANQSTLGQLAIIEVQNPSNGGAIFTVPASTTFTGTVTVISGGVASSTLEASAASGGVLAGVVTGASPSGSLTDVVDVSVAGGGGGNAITAVVSGSATGTILLVGYYK